MFTLTMTGSMAYPAARRVLMTERGNPIQYATYADAEAAAREMLARHPDWYDGFEVTPQQPTAARAKLNSYTLAQKQAMGHDQLKTLIMDAIASERPTPEPEVDYIKSYTEHGCQDRYIDDPAAVDAIGPYAWSGGYAIYYLGQDGDNGELVTLCPDCTKDELTNKTITRAFVRNSADDDDAYNGTGIQCEACPAWIVEHDAEEYAKNFDADGNDIR